MAKKTRAGTAWKQGYTAYKASGRYEKNRKRDLRKHVSENPNDNVAAKAVGAPIKYRRKKPAKKQGWVNGKVMFGMESYVGEQSNPCLPPELRKNCSMFTGQHSKATQMRVAQYMKMSRKTLNEMEHQERKKPTKK